MESLRTFLNTYTFVSVSQLRIDLKNFTFPGNYKPWYDVVNNPGFTADHYDSYRTSLTREITRKLVPITNKDLREYLLGYTFETLEKLKSDWQSFRVKPELVQVIQDNLAPMTVYNWKDYRQFIIANIDIQPPSTESSPPVPVWDWVQPTLFTGLLEVRNRLQPFVSLKFTDENGLPKPPAGFVKQILGFIVPREISAVLNDQINPAVSAVAAIDALIRHPVPVSLFGIQTDLGYISNLKYSSDRTLLYMEYKDKLTPFVVPRDSYKDMLKDVTDGITILQALKDPDLTTPPPMPFINLTQAYNDFRAAYRVYEDKTAAVKTYILIINNALLGTKYPYEPFKTFISSMGFYAPSRDSTSNTFMIYLSERTDGSLIGPGWNVEGLNGIQGRVMLLSFTANVYSDAVVNPGPPAISFPYVSNAVVIVDQPNDIRVGSSVMRLKFKPPEYAFSNAAVTGGLSLYDPRVYDASLLSGNVAPLRDLSSNVLTAEGRNVYHTVVDRGSGTGALIALAAVGPQDEYVYGGQSLWIPEIKRHTNFVLTQRLTLPLLANTFLGKTVQIDIFPRESADLISNMYLQFTLPVLPTGCYYTEMVGRAVIAKAEFLVGGIVYESITDDMYILHDQLFLDTDEKLGLYKLVSNGTPEGSNVVATSQINCIVPLDFFFCRRFSHRRKNKAPYFPMCALTASTVSVRFTFNSNTWITNSTTSIDLINPRLLIEEVTLTPEERLYYKLKKHRFKIPKWTKEATQNFTNGVVRVNLTANYPVSMMTWFIRNKKYEVQNANYYNSRYAYGYTTDYILAATPVTFPTGVNLRYIDTIDYATIYLNNNNVLSNFPGSLYYTFKQSLDHGLSTPSKSIYMYCFSERPTEYNQGGALDFSQLNAQTTHLDMKFLAQYAPQIQSEFSLNLFYYGYGVFEIADGQARLVS